MGVIWNIFIDGYWVERAGVGSGWEKCERRNTMHDGEEGKEG
jgi:hypothetical protein